MSTRLSCSMPAFDLSPVSFPKHLRFPVADQFDR